MSGLAPGGVARIYRDGEILCATLPVDQAGELNVRALQPGGYVARDESGGEFAFLVDPHRAEFALPVKSVGPDGQFELLEKPRRRRAPAKKKAAAKKPAAKKSGKKKG